MSTINFIIWNELHKSDYKIKDIEIIIYTKYIDIQTTFTDSSSLEHFSTKIFKQINYILNVNLNHNMFGLNLQMMNYNNIINLFENLNYPSNVNMMFIMIDTIISKSFLQMFNNIKLYNLPEQLEELKITSHIPFDLSNLPTKMFLLDISASECKFNLDYLPESIKILYLPDLPVIIQYNYKYQYELSDLLNLPSSLIEINIGTNRNLVYTSVKKLTENFQKDVDN